MGWCNFVGLGVEVADDMKLGTETADADAVVERVLCATQIGEIKGKVQPERTHLRFKLTYLFISGFHRE